MTGLLLASALLVVAVLALLLWPLFKARAGSSDASPHLPAHLAVLREQAMQLDAEHRAGLLDAAQHAAHGRGTLWHTRDRCGVECAEHPAGC